MKECLDEETAVFYVAEILTVLEYLHSKDIVYLDLKPENILLDDNGHIKLIDYGLSRETLRTSMLKSFCGSPAYLSPEMI